MRKIRRRRHVEILRQVDTSCKLFIDVKRYKEFKAMLESLLSEYEDVLAEYLKDAIREVIMWIEKVIRYAN